MNGPVPSRILALYIVLATWVAICRCVFGTRINNGDGDGDSIDKNGDATIAFYIAVQPPAQHLVKRLIPRIYHRSNMYLIEYHPSIKRSEYFEVSGSCAHNVFVRQAAFSSTHGVTEVLNTLDAMAFFIERSEVSSALDLPKFSFDYFIPMTATSYPTVSPTKLVQLLHTVGISHNWPSFFHFYHKSHLDMFKKEINGHYVDLALSFNASVPDSLYFRRMTHPDIRRRPFKFELGRSSPLFVASNRFVRFVVDHPKATRMLVTLGETSHVDHRFFAALIQISNAELIGPVVRSASLHCIDSDAIDIPLRAYALPTYELRHPSVDFLYKTTKPCLFVGPFDSSSKSRQTRNRIDVRLSVYPSRKSRSDSYAGYVFEKLNAVLK